MKIFLKNFSLGILVLVMAGACAPTKTLDVWKAEGYSGRIEKVLVVGISREEYIREQFERVLSNQLNDKGVYAIPSYQVLPEKGKDINKEGVLAAVAKTGVDKVLVARSIDHKEIKDYQYGGPFFAPKAIYSDGWYTFYVGSLEYPVREYDTTYYTVAINLFDVDSQKPIWSYLAEVKVTDSRQRAVNAFVPTLVEELEKSQLLK